MGEVATAWLAGGSGLVGGELLARLLRDDTFKAVVSFGRRTLPFEDPKLTQLTVDFSKPSTLTTEVAPAVAFSCLGTTMKKAGSRGAFRAVDHDAVLAFARAARSRGAHTFVHVTALGADPRSRVFYNAVKGDLEQDVAHLGFDSVYALRPSILGGQRPESRPVERAALLVLGALGPLLGKYRPTPAGAVAEAMLAVASAPRPGVHVVDAAAILNRAGRST